MLIERRSVLPLLAAPLLLAGVRLIVLADARSLPLADYDRRLSVDAVLQPTSDIAAVVQAIATAGPAIPHGAEAIERHRLLTPREAQIVQHVAAGLRNAQIASQIGIAQKKIIAAWRRTNKEDAEKYAVGIAIAKGKTTVTLKISKSAATMIAATMRRFGAFRSVRK